MLATSLLLGTLLAATSPEATARYMDARPSSAASALAAQGLVPLGHARDTSLAVASIGGDLRLFDRGVPLTDSLPFIDSRGRPSCAARFDEEGPAIVVHAAFDRSGSLVIVIDDRDGGSSRVTVDDGVAILAKCNCFGTSDKKKKCTDNDCSNGEDCNNGGTGSAYCRWSAGETIEQDTESVGGADQR
jgi:hypothetical protein